MRYTAFHIILIVLAAAMTWSCQDDMPYDIPSIGNPDGIVIFNLYIPSLDSGMTKAANEQTEDNIVNMSVLIFDGEKLAQRVEIGNSAADFTTLNSGNRQELKITLNEDLINNNSLQFCFLANYSYDERQSLFSINDMRSLLQLRTERIPDGSQANPVPFCAKVSLQELSAEPVCLHRSVAKITVTDLAKADGDVIVPGETDYPFTICNTNLKAPLFSCDANKFTSSVTEESYDTPAIHHPLYIFPTPADNQPAVIAKVPFNGVEENYYRIELKSDGGFIDILPDHHYQIVIKEISAPGYGSFEDAIKGGSSASVETGLIDRTPQILSIVSDGKKNLGTPSELVYSSSASTEGDPQTKLIVTYYSKTSTELDTHPTVSSGNSWIRTGDPIITKSGNSRVATYPVTFLNDGESGEHLGSIRIVWHNLGKEIPVRWNSELSLSSVCNSVLIIDRPGQTSLTISDYGTFIQGKGTSTALQGDAPVLYGISPESMGGTIRNQGFHFPVMYGERGSEWRYTYEIRMSSFRNLEDSEWSVRLDPKGDRTINDIVVIANGSGEHLQGADDIAFSLSRPANSASSSGGTDYGYGTGKLIFEIKNGSASRRLTLDLYHTGFFHYDAADSRYLTESFHRHSAGYYYYEVLPVATENGTFYILDRNIGATASGQFFENQLCESAFSATKGWPYSCGKLSAGDNFSLLPSSSGSSIDLTAIAPPGYTVPSSRTWKSIFSSTGCTVSSLYSGYDIYHSVAYRSSASEMGNVKTVWLYFPKIHYYEGTNIMGWKDLGYYWTGTEPGGITDPSQRGKWMEYMTLRDNSPSFTSGLASSLYMSVRCVNIQ